MPKDAYTVKKKVKKSPKKKMVIKTTKIIGKPPRPKK